MTKAVLYILNGLSAVVCYIFGMILIMSALLDMINDYYSVVIGVLLLFLASVCASGAYSDSESLV